MKLTREETLKLTATRLAEGLFGRYEISNIWPFGTFKGKEVQKLPVSYLYWHVLNNEQLNRYHLEYAHSLFKVCSWDFETWNKPDEEPEIGHYAGHYTGEPPASPKISEDYYWLKMRQAQGIFTPGTTINFNKGN